MKQLVGIIVVVALGYYLFNFIVNGDSFKNGVYYNKEYDFSMLFPRHWRETSEKEAKAFFDHGILPYGLDICFYATPTKPQEAVMAIQTFSRAVKINKEIMGQMINRFTSSGLKVEKNDVKQIQNFEVYGFSGTFEEFLHIEGAVFSVDNGLIMIQLNSLLPASEKVLDEFSKAIRTIKKI